MAYLIEGIFNGNVTPFSHCQTFTVDWSGVTLGTDVNLFYPEDTFSVTLNAGRLDMLRLLLEHTYALPRPNSSGVVCFIRPVTTGEDYDYEYELSGDHTF